MQRAAGGGQAAYTVYPVASYTFGSKQAKTDKDGATAERLARLQAK